MVGAINRNEAWIKKAVAVVTAGITIRARINSCDVARSTMFHAAAVKILLRDGQESLLALRGVNRQRIDETEAQRRLGLEDGGPAARQQYRADTCGRTCSRADGCTGTPDRGSANQRAQGGGGADCGRVLTKRSSALSFPKVGEAGQ